MSTTAPPGRHPARLLPLSATRLVGNGLFRFAYPFLAVIAVDVGLGRGAETLLIAGLAVGGIVLPSVSRRLLGDGDAPRRAATAGLVTLFVGTVLLGGVAPAVAATVPWLGAAVAIGAAVVLGLGKPLLDIGSMTYVSARVDWRGRGRAISIMELTWAGGLLVLAPLSAVANRTGWQSVLIGVGLVALACIPYLRRQLDDDVVTARLAGDDDEAASAASADAGSPRRSSWLFLAAFALTFVALESTLGVVSLWLEDVRGVDTTLVASLTAIGGVGELAGSLVTVAVVDRYGKARTAVVGMLCCAVGFGLLGVAGPLWLALVGLVVGLFGTETAIVAALALASGVEPNRRAAFLSRAVAAGSVARLVAGGGSALLLRQVGIGANTGVSVAAAIVAAAAIALLVRRDPRLRG